MHVDLLFRGWSHMVMPSKAQILYDDGRHRCIAFTGLVAGAGVQANQFLLIDGERGALIDPGGDLTFGPLSVEVGKLLPLQGLDYILASHQDPDIIAALGRWMSKTRAQVVVSKLWSRFLPHLGASHLDAFTLESLADRLVAVHDEGGVLVVGESRLLLLPAHFLHSPGNLHFYDVQSKILFSGDMGASIDGDDPGKPVEDFDAHIPSMKGFHERYMGSRKASRLWADMIRSLDVQAIVPQHGRPFRGKAMVGRFLDWVSDLDCGVDLVSPRTYALSREHRMALRR